MSSSLLILLVQVAVIVALGRVTGLLFARVRQPQVIGEMVAGILLGPSLLGWAWPWGYGALFPVESLPYLNALAQVGAVFFAFLLGLELDPRLVVGRGRSALGVSGAGIVVPFAAGVLLTVFLYPRVFDTGAVRIGPAALFVGAALAVTAFPVVARVLTERNLHRTEVGGLAIACAAFNDVASWCVLAVVVAAVRCAGVGQAGVVVLFSAVYLAAMFGVVRPFAARLEVVYERQGRLSQNVVAVLFLLILASAYTTAAIGLHALFGAFVTGWVMPKGTQFVRHLSEKLEDYTVVLLLPVFFAYVGLRTDLGVLAGWPVWAYAAAAVVVACAAKVGGVAVAGRWAGLTRRDAGAVGVLLNARGLMGLIVADVGLRAGVIPPAVFAMLVVMAVATTAMTAPLLHWIYPLRYLQALGSSVRTGGSSGERRRGFTVMIPVSLPKSGAPLVQLAESLIGEERDRSRLLAIHLRRPVDHDAYRSGLDEAAQSHDESLAPLLAQARGRMIPVEQISFISLDVAGDIATVARLNDADLVLMGFHKPVIGRTILGGTVHRVLQQCERDVAVFVDRGFRAARRVLVPYLGSPHDRLALELAHRIARHTEAQVTVLHIVAPMRYGDGGAAGVRSAVDRVFEEPGRKTPVTFRVIEDESPVGVVLHQSQNADLVIIGVGEEWGLESHLFGWRAQRIARDCPSSLLLVRKAGGRGGAGAAEGPGPGASADNPPG